MPGRLIEGSKQAPLLKPGEILIPKLLAQGMKVKVGDTVVLVATNLHGSVNGKTFVVRGVLDSASGPSGRDGYIDINDARSLLRMTQPEVNEIAIRLKDPAQLDQVYAQLSQALAGVANPQGKPALEVHTWADLSPFSSIVKHDRSAHAVHQDHAGFDRPGQRHERHDHGGVRAHPRDRHDLRHRHAAEAGSCRCSSPKGLLLGVGGTALGTVISLVVIYALESAQDRVQLRHAAGAGARRLRSAHATSA